MESFLLRRVYLAQGEQALRRELSRIDLEAEIRGLTILSKSLELVMAHPTPGFGMVVKLAYEGVLKVIADNIGRLEAELKALDEG